MSKKKKFIVLDVEGLSTCRPYNIGYVVTDKEGLIYESRSVFLPETTWENLQNCFCCREMTHSNIQRMLADYGSKDYDFKYQSVDDFIQAFEDDIKYYSIDTVWAYNVTFDFHSLKRLYDTRKMPDVAWCDIWSAVTYSRLLTKKYIKYCEDNLLLTPKGHIKTSAEAVYGYMLNNPTFCEEHTGLADVFIELDILLWSFKSKKKIIKKHTTPAWRLMEEIRK